MSYYGSPEYKAKVLQEQIEAYAAYALRHPGYVELPKEEVPTGECGASELAMHCRVVGARAERVWVNANRTYALVLLKDGRTTEGCWHAHSNGDWSVS